MSAAATPTVITQFGSAGKRVFADRYIEIQEMPLVSGNVSAVITATALSTVDYAIVIGCTLTAVPTYASGNQVTLAFSDPVATIKAVVLLFGK